MKNSLLVICHLASFQVSSMAQSGASEIAFEGGELASIELPSGGVAYKNHDQEFIYRIYTGKSGTVEKVTLQYGKEFNQKNVDLIGKALMNWKFHPHKEEGKIAEGAFYMIISLKVSPVDGRAWMSGIQSSLKIFDVMMPLAEVQELTAESRKNLVSEHQDYKIPKAGGKGILPE